MHRAGAAIDLGMAQCDSAAISLLTAITCSTLRHTTRVTSTRGTCHNWPAVLQLHSPALPATTFSTNTKILRSVLRLTTRC